MQTGRTIRRDDGSTRDLSRPSPVGDDGDGFFQFGRGVIPPSQIRPLSSPRSGRISEVRWLDEKIQIRDESAIPFGVGGVPVPLIVARQRRGTRTFRCDFSGREAGLLSSHYRWSWCCIGNPSGRWNGSFSRRRPIRCHSWGGWIFASEAGREGFRKWRSIHWRRSEPQWGGCQSVVCFWNAHSYSYLKEYCRAHGDSFAWERLLKGCNNDYHTRKMYHSRSYIPNTTLNALCPCATILSVDISRAHLSSQRSYQKYHTMIRTAFSHLLAIVHNPAYCVNLEEAFLLKPCHRLGAKAASEGCPWLTMRLLVFIVLKITHLTA